jgi:hypothetical protein
LGAAGYATRSWRSVIALGYYFEMSDDVQVRFGASIGELIEGVNQVKEAINSVGETVASVNDKFSTLAEIAGVSLSFEGIKQFVEGMAHLGTSTENSMATLGLSAEQVGQLSGVAKLTGTSFEALSQSFEHMTLNVQKSTKDAFNPAAEGLRVLGLSAKDLIGLPADKYFEKLADAVSKFNPSLNLTNALTAVGGRGITSLIPALQRGGEGFREFMRDVAATQGVLNDAQAHAFAGTHEKLSQLALSAEGAGIKLFSVLKPAIDAAADAMAPWLQGIDSNAIRDAINSAGTEIIDFGKNTAIVFINVKESWDRLIDAFASRWQAIAEPVGAVIDYVKEKYRQLGEATSDPGIFDRVQRTSVVFDQAKMSAEKSKAAVEDWAAAMKSGLATGVPKSGSFEAMVADAKVLDGELAAIADKYIKLNAAALPTGGKDQLAAMKEAVQEQIKQIDMQYQQTVQQLNAEVKLHQITEGQKTAILVDAIQTRIAAETLWLNKEQALRGLSAADMQKIENQKTQFAEKGNLDILRAVEHNIEDQKEKWNGLLSSVEGAFNSQLRGLLAGTTSWAQATKNILGDVTIKAIEGVEKMVREWVTGQLAMTIATQTSAAAQVAAQQAASAASLPGRATAFVSTITADAAQVFAGIFANLAPFLGPAAAGPAAAGQASVLAELTAIPKFALGTNLITNPGLAVLHAGEMVAPASAVAQGSGPFNGSGGGGGGINITFSPTIHGALNSNDVQVFMTRSVAQIAAAVNQYNARNPSSQG